MNTSPNSTQTPTEPLLRPEELEAGLQRAARLLRGFYEDLEDRPVWPGTPLPELVEAFAGTLGEEGVGLERALEDVERHVVPEAMAIPHPLYLGLINSSPLPGGIVAESIIGALNNNAGSWIQGPPFNAAEKEALRCLAGILGLPEDTSGIVLPGGSYTALHGLQLARQAKLPQWRREGARSLPGNPRVYVSADSHFSAARAALALGIAERDVVLVPTRGRGELDPRALEEILVEDRRRGDLPFALVATLGTTGTGAMDSLEELLPLCRAYDLWLHVDACYGGAAALLPELADRFRGIEQADSVAVDPHKWFFVPMVAGVLFTPHTELELETFDVDASYIPTSAYVDSFRRGLPTSRRGSGLALWMALRAHGLDRIRHEVRLNVDMARRLEHGLQELGMRVLEGGQLSIACARFEPAGLDEEELNHLQVRLAQAAVESGIAWFATVRSAGRTWLRFTFVSTFTREHHVDALVQRMGELMRELAPEVPGGRPGRR